DRVGPTEIATAPDKRTTKRGSPGKRHLSREAVFAIRPAALVAGGDDASFQAKDSVLPAREAARFRRSRWDWSEFPQPLRATHSRSRPAKHLDRKRLCPAAPHSIAVAAVQVGADRHCVRSLAQD